MHLRKFSLLCVFCLCFSCFPPSVYIDYNEDVDFKKYPTYNFYAPNTAISEQEENLIMDLIEENLQAKGLESQVISKFSIDFLVEFVQTENSFSFGAQYAGNIGASYSDLNNSSTYVVMTISFADALTSELFWQAVVEKKINPYISDEELTVLYQDFVELALANYPPKPEEKANLDEAKSKTNQTDDGASNSEKSNSTTQKETGK
ncbi:DUF4136 domain-containing protein [Psychroflexus salis]|uniref:DUF4136 domain-containing protein n=1 Tax=Psychroflexus salis TaxID=1526574 RepID=UPI0016645C05|nr:DUF4136 domain-containing protein [Psychroflexus salis]